MLAFLPTRAGRHSHHKKHRHRHRSGGSPKANSKSQRNSAEASRHNNAQHRPRSSGDPHELAAAAAAHPLQSQSASHLQQPIYLNQQLAERLSPVVSAAHAQTPAHMHPRTGRGASGSSPSRGHSNSYDGDAANSRAHMLMHSASTPNAPASFVVSGNDLQRHASQMTSQLTSAPSSHVSQQQLAFAPPSSSRHAATVQQHYANLSATSSLTSQSSISVAGSALADVIQLSSVSEGWPSLSLPPLRLLLLRPVPSDFRQKYNNPFQLMKQSPRPPL